MLSEMQAKAVNEFNKNILLLARAGTGKTFTVAQKIVKAESLGIKAEEILCLTFTVKAAEELREDIMKYCGDFHPEVFTIHGFCYRLMREYGRKTGRFSDRQIADEVDEGEIIKAILSDYIASGEYKTADGSVPVSAKNLVKAVSMIKHRRAETNVNYFSPAGYKAAINSLIAKNPDFRECFAVKQGSAKYTDENLISLIDRKGSEFMEKYRFALDSSSLCDFDDLIFSAREIISDINYQKPAYKLIIVDEMQDTSVYEYDVMKAFFRGSVVMLCGDEYQTIYGWRGSKPFEIIKNFKEEFGAVTVRLDKNRRSSPLLSYATSAYLNAAFDAGIPLDENDVLSAKDDEKIEICGTDGAEGEAKEIFDRILNFKGEAKDICVMARSNRYIAELYRRLEDINAGMPDDKKLYFFTADTHFQFYKKPLVKDYLAFFRLILNPDDEASLLRLASKSIEGVTPPMIAAIADYSAVGISVGQFIDEATYLFGDYYAPLINAYSQNKIVVYDLETTGLDTTNDEAIQISAVKTGKNGVKETFDRFIIPRAEIKSAALAVHGYGLDYIKSHGGEQADKVLADFCKFANGCVLTGHNSSSFDDIVLKRELKENDIPDNFGYFYDTLKIASVLKPQTSDYKLATLCEAFGIVNERAHDAFSDVTATEKVLKVFLTSYLIPTSDARKNVTKRYSVIFEDTYKKLGQMKNLLLSGELLPVFKSISETIGAKNLSSPKDKESINDLYRTMKGYIQKSEPISSLTTFLQDVSLSGSQMDVLCEKFNKIPLITVHQSKGCEFKEVILAGAGENEFPSYGAVLNHNEEEEKRVFYVALTRAKEKLVITYPKYKTFYDVSYKRNPSPYISYLPDSCVIRK